MNHSAHTATPTVRATITTDRGTRTEDVRCHDSGAQEGQVDEAHVTAVVRSIGILAGDRWPPRAVALIAADVDPWTFALIDADTEDTIGTLTIHHGAGA